MFCGSLVQNTATIEFNVLLSLAGVGVAPVARPAIYFTRNAETALTTVTAGLITWTDMTGGWYHVKIADDASLGGLIAKTLGLLDFMINNVAATYDAVYRRFQVVVDIPTAAAISDAVHDELYSGHNVAGSLGAIENKLVGLLANSMSTDTIRKIVSGMDKLTSKTGA